MSRAKTNAMRGKQKGSVPAKTKSGPGQLVSNYDGRKNINAGSYERRADNDSEPTGRVVEWRK